MMNPDQAATVAAEETNRGESKTQSPLDALVKEVSEASDSPAKAKEPEKAKSTTKAKKGDKEFTNVDDALDDALGDLSDLE